MKTPILLAVAVAGFLSLSAVLTVAGFRQFRRDEVPVQSSARKVLSFSKKFSYRRVEWAGDMRMAVALVSYLVRPEPWTANTQIAPYNLASTNPIASDAVAPLAPKSPAGDVLVTYDGAPEVPATNCAMPSSQSSFVAVATLPARMTYSRFASASAPAARSLQAMTSLSSTGRGSMFNCALGYSSVPVFNASQPLNTVSKFVFRNLRPATSR